jgi:hypothetical protein
VPIADVRPRLSCVDEGKDERIERIDLWLRAESVGSAEPQPRRGGLT